MKPTNIQDPEYFHKVVDCQYACPAHTPVPEYIRLIAAERYTEAYMVNWESNVFPGILGRTCDRPCEPACRRGRIEEEPVAICRLKRVAADNKEEVRHLMPAIPEKKNGKKIALIGGGPASVAGARRPGRVRSREERLLEIADRNFESFDRSSDVHVPSLRRKLGDDPKTPRHIETIRGVGYRLRRPSDDAL